MSALQAIRNERAWAEIESSLTADPFGPEFNAAQEVCGRYASTRGRVAIVIRHQNAPREVWTYAELDRYAAKAARVFARAGLRPGDRIAGLLSRQIESWITAIAAWRSGLIYVPLFGGFASDAIALRLQASHASAVVVDRKYRAALASAQSSHNLDPTVFVVNPAAKLDAGDKDLWAELDAAGADGPIWQTSASDTATLLFTSGTTGTPKACVMPQTSFLSVMPYARDVLGVSAGSTVFSTADPAWAFGLMTTGAAVMALGVKRVIYSGAFDPLVWNRIVREEEVTVLATVPSALRRMTDAVRGEGIAASLRSVAVSGEALVESLASEWVATGAPVAQNAYGLSELGMLLGDTIDTAGRWSPGMMSSELAGFDTFLADRVGNPVTAGEPGLVAVRRPRHQMSVAYENVPNLWHERWCGDVFVTEDQAERDREGRWRIVGRADDMIIASGHNLSPVEVESALLRHPCVVDAAAVAHNDAQRGIVLRAVVVRGDRSVDATALVQELKDLVAQQLGKYAAPRIVDFVDELPRSEVGKLRRVELRTI